MILVPEITYLILKNMKISGLSYLLGTSVPVFLGISRSAHKYVQTPDYKKNKLSDLVYIINFENKNHRDHLFINEWHHLNLNGMLFLYLDCLIKLLFI